MMRRVTTSLGVGCLVIGLSVTSAAADEAKTAVMPMLLNLTAPSAPPSSNSLLSEAMRAPAPRPRGVAALGGEIQPDGSVRYGDVAVMTIKNPCPEGSGHYEPPPLPGRRAKK